MFAIVVAAGFEFYPRYIDLRRKHDQVVAEVRDLPAILTPIYVWAGRSIHLNALQPVFESRNRSLGNFVFIGAHYWNPAVQALEAKSTCGGFAACLRFGVPTTLIAKPRDLKRLDRYMNEHYGRGLNVSLIKDTIPLKVYLVSGKP